MVASLSIKIKNLPEIKAKLQKMPEAMVKELDIAVRQTLAKVSRETMKEAPVNKQSGGGNLRQSIVTGMSGRASGLLTVNAQYAGFVHDGTAPHEIVPRDKKALANVRAGKFFGKKVNHPGTKPNPFLLRAIENSTDEVQTYFQEAVRRVAKK